MRYDPVVIWEPFVLALVLGLVVSGGLYYAYLWPSVEPLDPDDPPILHPAPLPPPKPDPEPHAAPEAAADAEPPAA
jgi:hypothetical protein